MRPAVELSYLDEDCQRDVVDEIDLNDATPSHDQTIRMRKLFNEGNLTTEAIHAVMSEEKPNQKEKIVLRGDRVRQLIPKNIPVSQTEDFVCKALEYYNKFLQPSMVLLEQIRTVNREDLREYIGTVDDDKLFRQINATLKKTFGLWVYKPEGKENIRCLCPKCLNDYIHNPDYIVRRLDPFAKRKDRCDKCDGDGWDYVVTDRYSSKKEKRGSNDRK